MEVEHGEFGGGEAVVKVVQSRQKEGRRDIRAVNRQRRVVAAFPDARDRGRQRIS